MKRWLYFMLHPRRGMKDGVIVNDRFVIYRLHPRHDLYGDLLGVASLLTDFSADVHFQAEPGAGDPRRIQR
jgi:hypothetical protein